MTLVFLHYPPLPVLLAAATLLAALAPRLPRRWSAPAALGAVLAGVGLALWALAEAVPYEELLPLLLLPTLACALSLGKGGEE